MTTLCDYIVFLFYCHKPYLLTHSGCVTHICTIICCRFHIYISQESWVLCLLLLCSLMMYANDWVHYGLMVTYGYLHITLPHYHHYANLSEGNLSRVCLRLDQFSQLSFIQYMGCVYSAYPFILWWLWEYLYLMLLSSSNWKYDLFAIV